MFGRNSKDAPVEKIETVIGPNTNFKGRLVCDGSIRIDGVCEESVIESLGNIVISPQAKVSAELIAQNISVSGAVTGKIKASGRLEILSTGKVWGDVDVGSFLLDEEGYFKGNLTMQEDLEPPEFSVKSADSDSPDPEEDESEDQKAVEQTP